MQTLTDSLFKQISDSGVEIVSDTCTKIESSGKSITVDSLRGPVDIPADHIVSAIPSSGLSKILKHSPLNDYLREIPAVDVGVVNLVFNGHVIENPGFGFLVPEPQKACGILGVVFDSSAMPAQDLAGKTTTRLTVMLPIPTAKKNSEEQTKSQLLKTSLEALGLFLNIPAGELLEHHVHIHHQCIPQYNVGHSQLVSRIQNQLQDLPFLSLIGASYKGVAINDIVKEAKYTADQIRAMFYL